MKNIFIYSLIPLIFLSCETVVKEESKEDTKPEYTHHSDWSMSASIYELNIRQFSEKGDFNSIIPELDRIKNMGIDIIWLMPIHPIGEENRKGGLGSYYSVQDYKAVNPNYGSLDDFKRLVDEIHKREMFVIIDWVANHTAWDNPWVKEHPDWYSKDSTGNLMPPEGTDWSDVVDLNYDNIEMRAAMVDALSYWITECNIDGYRCDVADWVPLDFWIDTRKILDSLNPDVFMLAEAENPKHHPEAFDASYAWELHHISNEIAKGKMNFDSLEHYMIKEDTNFHESAYRLTFTSNHDENSWNGTVFERYGDNYKNWAVLMTTLNGMPLIYSGQESAMNERLRFFEKDTIKWEDYRLGDFYTELLSLKDNNRALWNGKFGGDFRRIKRAEQNENNLVFSRSLNSNVVMVMLNFGSDTVNISGELLPSGNYTSFGSDKVISVNDSSEHIIPANNFLLFTKSE